MFAAVAAGAAAGGYDSIEEAARRMAHLSEDAYEPNEAHHAVYNDLYAEYVAPARPVRARRRRRDEEPQTDP